ncbi:MAG: CBS domain-containing protein [Candidatus Moduliflexus flocculans]|nr:CBS domain-containing protein [Candidatus Moduliflexus flocculans]
MENHINGAPVVDRQGKLVGILCRDDLISQQKKLPLPSYFVVLDGIIPLISPKHSEREMDKIAAATGPQAMTPNPVTATPQTDIEEVASAMVDKKIHTLPVIGTDGSLAGAAGGGGRSERS